MSQEAAGLPPVGHWPERTWPQRRLNLSAVLNERRGDSRPLTPKGERKGGSTIMLGHLGLLVAALGAAGCAQPTVSKSPDSSRTLAPVPACVRNLSRGTTEAGYVQQLPEKELWTFVVPELAQGQPTSSTTACNGEPVFASEALRGATPQADAIEEGRITYGGGANRLKIAWLRTHRVEGGFEAGPLALIRTLEGRSEVYGVGSYRGDPEKSRFSLERLGDEVVVTAVSDGCAAENPAVACDTELTVFLPSSGRLDPIAQIGLERVRQARGIEPGVRGSLRFRFVSSPAYEKDGIHLIEEVSVTDEAGRDLRRAEFERILYLEGATVEPSAESLWDRLYVSRTGDTSSQSSPSETEAPSGEGEIDSAKADSGASPAMVR